MGKIELIRLDSTDNPKYVLCGEEIELGRGSALGCDDKRVSRDHGVLQRSDDGSFVLVAHNTNPCFYKTQGQDTFAVLMKGQKKTLFIGDQFALLPHSFCYQITIKNEDELTDANAVHNSDIQSPSTSIDVRTVESLTPSKKKRKLPQWLLDLPKTDSIQPKAKKGKRHQAVQQSENNTVGIGNDEVNKNIPQPNVAVLATTVTNGTNQEPLATAVEDHHSNDVKTAEVKPEVDENPLSDCANEPKSDEEVSVENDELTTQATNEQGTPKKTAANNTDPGQGSSTNTTRDSCMYGKDCFRKNTEHRLEFSHPGDADFDVNTNNLPECQYGTACYRKNVQHRKDFKHTKRMPRAAAQQADAARTSNVFCTNCTITYNVCTRCQRMDTEVIDLTKSDS